jgi:hypothetical protein
MKLMTNDDSLHGMEASVLYFGITVEFMIERVEREKGICPTQDIR